MSTLATYTSLAAYFLGPLAFFILVHRLTSHPLNKFPGPAVARVTDGYAGYHAARRQLHLATYRDHERYGPVVRQGPDRLVFNTITALHDIYLNQRVTKSKIYLQSLLSTPTPSMFNALDRAVHSHKRRVVGQLISERSMRAFEPTMVSQIDIFLRQLLISSESDETINMTTRCQRLGADVVGLLAFGYELNTQTADTNIIIPAAMKANSYRISLYMAWPTIRLIDPAFRWLGRKKSPKCMQTFRLFQVLRSMIGRRMSMPRDAAHDLYAVASGDITPSGDRGLQGTELWSEASFFVMAGGTTVATLMSAIFFYLSRHADVYTRLADEIRTAFSSGQAIKGGPQLSSCKYLRAVIDETMRVSPPTTATPWREEDIYSAAPAPAPSDGSPFLVDGHAIPRGTAVGVSLYSLMHNAAYFPEPFAFRPERWLGGADDGGSDGAFDEATRATMRRALAPFALGDRGCAGKAMAYLEASLAVAKTLWYFDFRTVEGPAGRVGGGTPGRDWRDRVDEYQLYDIFTADHDGPNLVFKPRAGVKGELASESVV
ncbi:cytochrome P450 [Xylariaceae sp. FL0662B]|nr:cytochrome P450 [Xylariaceae sp. FL0662B]